MQGPDDHRRLDERLTRLEEGLAFAQHDLDGLSGQVRDLFAELAGLRQRVEAAERRLARSEQQGTAEGTDGVEG